MLNESKLHSRLLLYGQTPTSNLIESPGLNLYNSAYIVTSVCQLLLWEWFCSSILLTEYKQKWRKSTILFESFNKKRETLRQITALSFRIFTINTVILFLVAILRLHSYQICIKQTWVIDNATLPFEWEERELHGLHWFSVFFS